MLYVTYNALFHPLAHFPGQIRCLLRHTIHGNTDKWRHGSVARFSAQRIWERGSRGSYQVELYRWPGVERHILP